MRKAAMIILLSVIVGYPVGGYFEGYGYNYVYGEMK